MNTTQDSTLFTLRRIEEFLDDNSASFPGLDQTGTRKDLAADIVTLSTHATTQKLNTDSARGATQKHSTLRTILLEDHMRPIARIARAKLSGVPELSALRMPRNNLSVEALTAAAAAMGEQATRFASVFIAAGQPGDFVQQLADATTALKAPISSRNANLSQRSTATEGLKTKLSDARKTVHILDSYVRTALRGNPALLAGWEQVKHVTKTRTKPKSTTTTLTPTAPASTDATQSHPTA